MRKLLVFVLLLIFFLRGLANEKKVFIKGTFLQTKMSSVNLLYYDIIKENFCYLSTSDVSEKGFFLMTFQLKKPILCKFYEDFFFVTPGDSINIYIEDDSNSSKGYKLKLEGKNVSHYKFSNFVKTHSTIDIDKELKNYDGNWQVFQKTCLKKYNEDMELLNLYSSLDSVSVDFYDYYKNNFFCEYLQYLLLPPHVDKNYDWYLINSFLKSIHLDTIFKSVSLFDHQAFRQFCTDYLKFIVTRELTLTDAFMESILLYNYINANYQNKIREYFLVFLYNKCLKIKSIETKEVVESIFTMSLEFKDDFIRDNIKSKYTLFANINKTLPDSIINLNMTTIRGNTITLKKIINSLNGKYILIDNWATWCVPCLQEIDKAKEFQRTGILKKDKIEILYLSQDKDLLSWKNYSSKNMKVFKNNYLFFDVPNSFMRYFNITSIPRYILLDRDGKLIDLAAPNLFDYNEILKLLR